MLVIFLVSCAFGLFYEDLFNGYTTQIVAHRTGGKKFSENSLDGIDYAVECGCYASEIDVRLTKDGVFVVNHDDTFERMNGNHEDSGSDLGGNPELADSGYHRYQ